MRLDLITPMLITFNEEHNIDRTLARLSWAKEILVVDSGSTDATLERVRALAQARVLHRPFDSFARQCNAGLAEIRTEWALSLDADYELGDGWLDEVRALDESDLKAGYRCRFVYRIYGRPLRGTLYPPRVVLYRRDSASYRDEGHGHRVEVAGEVGELAAPIYHDDRKPLRRWFASQQSYAAREADYLLNMPQSQMKLSDRVRLRIWAAPPLALLYALLVKGCLLDGWPGWYYAWQRLTFELLLSLEMLDRRLRAAPP